MKILHLKINGDAVDQMNWYEMTWQGVGMKRMGVGELESVVGIKRPGRSGTKRPKTTETRNDSCS